LICCLVEQSRSQSGHVGGSRNRSRSRHSPSPKRHKHDALYTAPLCSRETLLKELDSLERVVHKYDSAEKHCETLLEELESLERIVRKHDSAEKSTSRHRIHSRSQTRFGNDARRRRSPLGSREIATRCESHLYVRHPVVIEPLRAPHYYLAFAQHLRQPSAYGLSGLDGAPCVSAVGSGRCIQLFPPDSIPVDHPPLSPSVLVPAAGGLDRGPMVSKELSPRDEGEDFSCPVCPSEHICQTREELRLHLTVVHHCDLVQDLLNGGDVVVPLTGRVLKRKLDEYCAKSKAHCWKLDVSRGPSRLQQGEENAATCTSSTYVVVNVTRSQVTSSTAVAAPTVTPSSAASKPRVRGPDTGAAPNVRSTAAGGSQVSVVRASRITTLVTSAVNFTPQQQQPESVASSQPRLPSQIDTQPPALGQKVQPSSQPVVSDGRASNTAKQQDAADLCKQSPPCTSTSSSKALSPNLTATASLRLPTATNVRSTVSPNLTATASLRLPTAANVRSTVSPNLTATALLGLPTAPNVRSTAAGGSQVSVVNMSVATTSSSSTWSSQPGEIYLYCF